MSAPKILILSKIKIVWILLLLIGSLAPVTGSYSQDHLIAISHQNDVNKKITVYTPDGNLVYFYVPTGSYGENTPRFFHVIPSLKKFLVTCPDGEEETGGSVELFDYSAFPGAIVHEETLETGNRPFHVDVTPDQLFCVSNDGDDTFSFIDPITRTIETLVGGHHHTTFGFALTESGYDIYATRFSGAGNSGGVDIVDGLTRLIRTADSEILPLPHSTVYSPVTQKIYIGCAGGIEVFGTTGDEKDLHLKTFPTTEGHMTPTLRLSPDGLHLIGNCHWDGEVGSYFYSIDLETEEMKTVSSVSCKGYAYSPDGKWIVAGDYNKPAEQERQWVHIIDCDPGSDKYMTIIKEFELDPSSQAGFFAQEFSPDSRFAYLGLIQSDKIMVVDVSTLSAMEFDCEAAPFILSVLPLSEESSLSNWLQY